MIKFENLCVRESMLCFSGKRSGLSINQTRCISNSEKNFSTGISLKVEGKVI